MGLKMDGVIIPEDSYTAVSGSTIVTLKKSYLDTLSKGSHTLSFMYTDGNANATLTINKPNNPNTSDNIMIYINILCLSSLGLVILETNLKKSKDIYLK